MIFDFGQGKNRSFLLEISILPEIKSFTSGLTINSQVKASLCALCEILLTVFRDFEFHLCKLYKEFL